MMSYLLAALRRIQTYIAVHGRSRYLSVSDGLHVGHGTKLWAPVSLKIGRCVYIGKQVHIEANADIGDYCLIANRVAIIGRHDHDFTRIGLPVRFSPWIGARKQSSEYLNEKAVIGDDTWLGYGVIVLTGVNIGRGCIVAAGSVVANDLPPYSIAAGVPAKRIKSRFNSVEECAKHERLIQGGEFEFSERGYDECVINVKVDEGGNIE